MGVIEIVQTKEFYCGNSRINDTGGFMIKLLNKTGSATVKGSVVACSDSVDNAFKLQDNEYDSIGIVYESGIADGVAAWIVIYGIAEVLFKDGESSTREYVVLAADTNGRALNIDVPSGNPVQAEHFKEIGHVLESKVAGTNVLVKCVLHFN
jgi:hypothetical protein